MEDAGFEGDKVRGRTTNQKAEMMNSETGALTIRTERKSRLEELLGSTLTGPGGS